MPSTGLFVQMDGSPHRWFGDSKSCLIAAIDDANSELHAEFFPSETTLGCMKVLQEWKRYGMQTIPMRVEKSRFNFDPFSEMKPLE